MWWRNAADRAAGARSRWRTDRERNRAAAQAKRAPLDKFAAREKELEREAKLALTRLEAKGYPGAEVKVVSEDGKSTERAVWDLGAGTASFKGETSGTRYYLYSTGKVRNSVGAAIHENGHAYVIETLRQLGQ